MNSCTFTGRITKDAELKTSQAGKSFCYFCLAVDDGKDYDGNKVTSFIDCIAYTSQAEFLAKYVKKGDLLAVNGRLHVTLNEDKDGNKTKRATIKVSSVESLTPKPKITETAKETAKETAPVISETEKATEKPNELPFEI